MLASVCPGWVCYAEKTHGSYVLPYISTAKSPQAVMGTAVKRQWALAAGVDPARVASAIMAGQRLAVPPEADLPGAGQLPSLERYMALMERCWAQEPALRPSFSVILRELRAQLEALRGNAAPLARLQSSRTSSAIQRVEQQWRL